MRRILLTFAAIALASQAHASDVRGQLLFNGMPLPGATVTITQGAAKFSAVSDEDGRYTITGANDGPGKLHAEMLCFAPIDSDITVTPNAPGLALEMKMLPVDQVMAQTKIEKAVTRTVVAEEKPVAKPGEKKADEPPPPPPPSEQANDGLLVNGSSNNANTSKFSLAQGFGNTRKGSTSLYTGGLGLHYDTSALDAKPYSISGVQAPKQSYNIVTLVASLSGPLKIPHLMPRGPNFFTVYQWTRDRDALLQTGLVPTLSQRIATDPIAQALLNYYPLPNIAGLANYNYQIPILANTHQDSFQLRMDKSFNQRNQLNGSIATESSRADTTNLFGFRDTTDTLGIDAKLNYNRRIARGLYGNIGYRFTRLRTNVTPFFANRINVSGNAGLTGTLQDPQNYGPPTLVFSSGIASLTDANSSFNRNRTEAVNPVLSYYRGRHNFTLGGDFRRQEYNYLQQANPRGTFTFTGAAFGSDIADFQRGVPDTASISYGNADKYLRQSVSDAYIADDWRIRSDLTLNLGVRWEYGAPIYELKNRLANLDVVDNFGAVATVLATSPKGALSGQNYPRSLIRPTRNRIEPRIGLSWRPIPASSLVVRAGYGVYTDTSVYRASALSLAQQEPFSHTIQANNADCAQTLSTGPTACSSSTASTFAIDPNFRVGYAQTWQIAAQRDLPWALQMTATYSGVKGTRGVQEFLPNTYAIGATNPCPSCPVGFVYRTSNGNSIRHAGIFQLRRRLRSGLTASAQYTYSKSIDNDSVLGGQGATAGGITTQTTTNSTIAQDWTNLRGERGPSSFDQRHLLTGTLQYTTGMGLGGGTLLSGWRGKVYKEWTVLAELSTGTGLPENPIYFAAASGTGYTGTLRPDRTTASPYDAPAGRYRNPAAFTAPKPGSYGNAGRNSITGPSQFTLDTSLARTFRLTKRFTFDVRVDAHNILNRVVFASYNVTVNPSLVSPIFGLPTSANDMRKLQTTARLRF